MLYRGIVDDSFNVHLRDRKGVYCLLDLPTSSKRTMPKSNKVNVILFKLSDELCFPPDQH